jgi:hypothetical protein
MAKSKLDHALELAALGFYVFPIAAGKKAPPAVKDWQTWATRSPAKIGHWWTNGPDHNIGISTSKFGDGQALLVVDVDNKNGKRGNDELLRLELEGYDLPATAEQRTPTGGRHIIFAVRESVRQGVDILGPGLDVRSRGGYIVGAGSTVRAGGYDINGGRVADAPAWLVDRCGVRPERDGSDARSSQHLAVDADSATARAIHYLTHEAPLAVEGQGGDETTYKVAARLKDLGVTMDHVDDLMALHWNPRCSPPWDPDEMFAKVKNAYKYGQEPPGIAAPEAVFPPVEEPKPAAPKHARFISITDALAAVRPIDWQVDGWIEAQGLGMLWGESETWKSFITVSWALCTAAGADWHGRKVKQGPVIYFAGEGQRGIARRAAAWAQHNNVKLEGIPLLISRGSTNVRQKEAIEAVQEAVNLFGANPRLIIVDTLHRNFGGGDENNSQDVGTMLEVLDRCVAQPLQCAVILVHHANKDGGTFRGSSSLRNSMDFEFSTSRAGDIVTLTPEKMKEAEKPEVIAFAAKSVVTEFQHGLDSSLVLEQTVVRQGARPKKLRSVISDVLMGMGEGWHAVLDVRRKVLADCAARGTPEPSRQSINRELGALEDSNWLTREDGKVRVNKVEDPFQ